MHYYRILGIREPPGSARSCETTPSSRDGMAVYFYLGTLSSEPISKQSGAIPYFERLLKEFSMSEHLEDAQKRLEELRLNSWRRRRIRPPGRDPR